MTIKNELDAAVDARLMESGSEVDVQDGPRSRADVLAERSLHAEALASLHDWYIAEGATSEGPLRLEQLRERWQLGQLGPDTTCWREGFSGWRKLSRVSELQLALSPIPAPVSVESFARARIAAEVAAAPPRPAFKPRATDALWALREGPRRPMPPPPLPPEARRAAPATPAPERIFVSTPLLTEPAPAPAPARQSRVLPITLALVSVLVVVNGALLWKLNGAPAPAAPVAAAPVAATAPPAQGVPAQVAPATAPARVAKRKPVKTSRARKSRTPARVTRLKEAEHEAYPGATVMTFEEKKTVATAGASEQSAEADFEREAQALEDSLE